MAAPSFSFQIVVTKTHPMGPFCYVARVAYLYEQRTSGNTALLWPCGERIGSTEQEARQRLEDAVLAWIATHTDTIAGCSRSA